MSGARGFGPKRTLSQGIACIAKASICRLKYPAGVRIFRLRCYGGGVVRTNMIMMMNDDDGRYLGLF